MKFRRAINVVMTFVTAGLVERAGRCLLLMVSAGGMAFSSFLVSFSFYFKDIGRGHLSPGLITFINLLALFSLLVYAMTFSLGVGPVPWIVMGEILPARVRGIGGSFAILMSWLSAWIVTLTFNFLLEWSAPGCVLSIILYLTYFHIFRHLHLLMVILCLAFVIAAPPYFLIGESFSKE